MFSKFLTSLFATKVVAFTVVSNPASGVGIPTTTLTCNQCVQQGYTWCQNQDWYLDMSATTGIPSSICCDLRSGGTCGTAAQESDVTYSCTSTFASQQQAIAACPTKQSICGTKSIELIKGETKQLTIVANNLVETEPCTWIIKSNCGAPGFTYDTTNTMTSTQALLQVNEWDSQQVTADTKYAPWPMHKFNTTDPTKIDPITYWNDGYQVQPDYSDAGGMLGNIRYHPMFNTTTRSTYNQTIPGNLITDWIASKVSEFTLYEAELKTYNYKRKEYNGALRLKGKVTKLDTSYRSSLDAYLPTNLQSSSGTGYTAPTLTSIPFHPFQYKGPEIKNGDPTAVEIDVGFGSPTTYMYTLKDGSTSTANPEYRMFGSMGTTKTTKATGKTDSFAVRLDSTSGARFQTCEPGRYSYMALTLLPVAGYTQATNSEVFNITVGAYEWKSDIYLTKTTQPVAPLLPDTEYALGAYNLQTAVFSTLVALTVAQLV